MINPILIVGDPRHNHNRKVAQLMTEMQLDGLRLGIVDVRHDDFCLLLRGRGFCNCDPSIIVDGETLEPSSAEWKNAPLETVSIVEEMPSSGTLGGRPCSESK